MFRFNPSNLSNIIVNSTSTGFNEELPCPLDEVEIPRGDIDRGAENNLIIW